MPVPPPSSRASVTQRRVLSLWWPLAGSWLLMGAELPMVAAVVARMPDPRVHLGAYGSLVFPVSLVIEAPIIMMLAASTALAGDRRSYRRLYRFMMLLSAGLTALHVLVAFTPVYYVLARQVMHLPAEMVEPARWGLQIMTPWTWAIAHRRFHQGVLIRFDRSRVVGEGTLVRLGANACVLAAGFVHGGLPGIVVGATAVASGVVAEAVYVRLRVHPVLHGELRRAPLEETPLTSGEMLRFYFPLALTPVLALLTQPVAAAAMNRMPEAVLSVAAWPAVSGLVFLTRSVGFAFNEVVVRLAGEPEGYRALPRFGGIMALVTTTVLLTVGLTPLSEIWFARITGLEPELTSLCRVALVLAALLPGYSVLQSLYQGALVQSRRTRGVIEATAIYLVSAALFLGLGVVWQGPTGLYFAICAVTAAGVLQVAWLGWRSRHLFRAPPVEAPAPPPPVRQYSTSRRSSP